jgi:hypothetical protein
MKKSLAGITPRSHKENKSRERERERQERKQTVGIRRSTNEQQTHQYWHKSGKKLQALSEQHQRATDTSILLAQERKETTDSSSLGTDRCINRRDTKA